MTRLVIYFNELRAWGERLENSSVPQAKYGLRGMSGEEYSWAHLGTKWKKTWEVSNLVNFMVSLNFKYLRAFYMTERGEERKNQMLWFSEILSHPAGLKTWWKRLKIRQLDLCSLTWHQWCFHVVHTSDHRAAVQGAKADLYFNCFKVLKWRSFLKKDIWATSLRYSSVPPRV